MRWRHFRPGDKIVYRKSKHTRRPGRRAKCVRATSKGDCYSYFVDKFWIVRQVLDDGHLLVETPRGKRHIISQGDRNLRHPSILQRLRFRARFAAFRQSQGEQG